MKEPILVMFDIDGTLLDSVDLDSDLFEETVHAVTGIALSTEWCSYEHVTDVGIVQEVLRQHGREHELDVIAEEVEQRFVSRLEERLAAISNGIEQIPGAREYLHFIRDHPSCIAAIATGGFASSAQLKLRTSGIAIDGIAFASTGDAVSRPEIMLAAERRALHGTKPRRRLYFGDGAWDLAACRVLGYEFIAVGSAVEHQARIDDFSDIDQLAQLIGLT